MKTTMQQNLRLTLGLALATAAVSASAQFDGPAPLAWRWSESTSAAVSGSPAVSGDTVYTAVGGRIYALDRETGNLLWRFPSGAPLESNFRTGVAEANGTVYAASDSRVLYAVDAKSGSLKWQHNSTDDIVGQPVAAGSAIAFATAGSGIVAVKAGDGALAWEKPFTRTGRILPNLAAFEGGIIYCTGDAKIGCVDVDSQKSRWETTFIGRFSSDMSPKVYGDGIYVVNDSYITVLRVGTGKPRAQMKANQRFAFSCSVSQKGVLAMDERGNLYTYDLNLKPTSRTGFPTGSIPQAAPSWVGKYAAVPHSNGDIVLIDPITGEKTWSYNVPSLVRAGSTTTPGGGAGPGDGFGGPTGGGGGAMAGGGGAGGVGGQNPTTATVSKVSLVSGAPIEQGGTLMVLTRDGSLLAFDRVNGVDLTPPVAKLVWPNPGDQISPNPPAEFVFLVSDYTSGINPATITVTMGGKPLVHEFRDGILRIKFLSGGRNTLMNGRQTISVTAADWLGNSSTTSFAVLVDSGIARPLGSPPTTQQNTQGGFGGGQGGDGKSGGG